MADNIKFRITVMNANKLIYSGEAVSAVFTGDVTEYEVMPYHAPLIGVLKQGDIVIDGKIIVPIAKGLVKFMDNDCVIMAEEVVMPDDELGKPEKV